MPLVNTTKTASHAERIFIKIPPVIKPANEHVATKSAYGICVATCSKCGQAAPVEDKIVVSEIGDAWSPKTAPPRTAEIQIKTALNAAFCANPAFSVNPTTIGIIIGIMMPNVPQLVPVANAITADSAKTIAGSIHNGKELFTTSSER